MLRKKLGVAAAATLAGVGLSLAGVVPAQAAPVVTTYGTLPGALNTWGSYADFLSRVVPAPVPEGMADAAAPAGAEGAVTVAAKDGSQTITVGDKAAQVGSAVGQLDKVNWTFDLDGHFTAGNSPVPIRLTAAELKGLLSGVTIDATINGESKPWAETNPSFVIDQRITFDASGNASVALNKETTTDVSGYPWAGKDTDGTQGRGYRTFNRLQGTATDKAKAAITDFNNKFPGADKTFSTQVSGAADALNTFVESPLTLTLPDQSFALGFDQLNAGDSYTVDPKEVVSESTLGALNKTASGGVDMNNVTMHSLLGEDAYKLVQSDYEAVEGRDVTMDQLYADQVNAQIANGALDGTLDNAADQIVALVSDQLNSSLSGLKSFAENTESFGTGNFYAAYGCAGTLTLSSSWQQQVHAAAVDLINQKIAHNENGLANAVISAQSGSFSFASSVSAEVSQVVPTGIQAAPAAGAAGAPGADQGAAAGANAATGGLSALSTHPGAAAGVLGLSVALLAGVAALLWRRRQLAAVAV